jgi:hypothetical protein
MTTTQSTTRQADQTPDRSRELERAITEALVVALGKRAAHRVLRHTRAKPHPARQRNLLQVVGHLAGYGALITYGWHQWRRARQSAAA